MQQFSNEFFDEFWSYFKDAHAICQTKPEFIVKCVRLIEEDKAYLNNIKKIFKLYNSPDEKFRGINDCLMISRKTKVRDTMMVEEEEVLVVLLLPLLKQQVKPPQQELLEEANK